MLSATVIEMRRGSAHAGRPAAREAGEVMELRHLRYFVAVAEDLHFRRAAERLHVAQPAVSEQIRKLEQELGVRLFDRTQRRVALTPAGVAMLEEARQILRHAERACYVAREASDRAALHLRIGYLPDSLPSIVPRALRQLRIRWPGIEIEMQSGAALRLIEDIRGERLDAVITALPTPTTGLRVTSIGQQGAAAVLPASHSLARAESVTLERLAPERIIVLPQDANPAFRSAVVSMCRDAGLAPTLVETPEPRVDHVLLSVAAGAGIALVPASAAERYTTPGVRFVPVAHEDAALRDVLLTPAHTASVAAHALIDAISHAARVRPLDPSVPALAGAA